MENKSIKAVKQWNNVGYRPHHGVAIPLFSVWTKKSAGIGEYLDLIPLIDWCHEVGFDVIQLLPLNDTGDGKSPYSAISAFALNPLHLSLSDLPGFKDSSLASLQNQKSSLINYPLVAKLKEEFLKEYFLKERENFLKKNAFIKFKKENAWLEGYAQFKARKNPEDKPFYEYVQYLCFQQMLAVKEHAEQKGVFIKGDIPILISSASADLFLNKDFFMPHLKAGAPPDEYSVEGQSWGFPVYDWERSYDKIIAWWQERLQVASKLYHLYRLDHVVGLFRIYVIPENKTSLEGFFLPKEEEKWLPLGTKILETFLEACPMLPIGEDLGTVPLNVKMRLVELGIPGTKVIRWEWIEPEKEMYYPVASYPLTSMTTVSTHDTETLKKWWQGNPKEAKAFCKANGMIFREKFDDQVRKELLTLSHKSGSLFHINQLQEYFPEGSPMSFEDEEEARTNDPADEPRELNWAIRWKVPLEEILTYEPLKMMVRTILSKEPHGKDL